MIGIPIIHFKRPFLSIHNFNFFRRFWALQFQIACQKIRTFYKPKKRPRGLQFFPVLKTKEQVLKFEVFNFQ